jgi:tetratricopeptide (TPR) repeat protein
VPVHRVANVVEMLEGIARGDPRFDLDETVKTFRDAVLLVPQGDPARAGALSNLGAALRIRFVQTGWLADIDESILTHREAVSSLAPDQPDLTGYLSNLGAALGTRFNRTGRLGDLDEAIQISREALTASPADDPDRETVRSTLGAALQTRFERTGQLVDLDEAIKADRDAAEATPPTHPDRTGRLSNLGAALRSRFERSGRMGDLDEAIQAGRDAVRATSADHQYRAGYLSNLGITLRTRYERAGRMADLDEAIRVSRLAVVATRPDNPYRAGRLSNLGMALQTRFQRAGRLQDLEAALKACRDAVATVPADHPERAIYLSSLAAVLTSQFAWDGKLKYLEEAIKADREALAATPPDLPNRAHRLTNLGIALGARFERTGQLEDLHQAIRLHRESVQSTPLDHPDRSGLLSNLGTTLRMLFDVSGRQSDLEQAILQLREAVSLVPPDHPARSKYYSNLGAALGTRFSRTGRLADLDEAIDVGRTAVTAGSFDPSDRAGVLLGLGLTLQLRFYRSGLLADLDEAIETTREAVHTVSDSQPDRPRNLSNLGGALWTRFEWTGQLADLDEAVESHRQAVEATPDSHPNRAMYLSNLGVALRSRWERTGGEDPDLRGVVACFREAAESRVVAPAVACAAAAEWGRLVSGPEAVRAFELALGLLPRVSGPWLGYEDSVAQGRSVSNVGRDAAAAFIDAGHPERALVTVEQAAAVTFSRMLQSRGDLTELRAVRPDLEERVAAALGVLNAGERQPAVGQMTFKVPELGLAVDQVELARRDASAALEAALDEVRGLGGRWARFFLPPLVEDLTRAAAAGPIVVLVVAQRRCDALVVTTTAVQVVKLPDLTEEQAIERATRFLADTRALSSRDATPEQRTAAHRGMGELCGWMWDTIVGPVLEHLGHTGPTPGEDYRSWPRVWWLPTGPLAILPIHAAGHHPHTPDAAPGGPAVMDRVVSSTLPTIGSLIASREADRDYPRKALLVGMPHTPPVDGQPVSDLPGVSAELDAVGRQLYSTPVLALIEGQADVAAPTKRVLLAELPRHGWVHLACHALTDSFNPTASTLLLDDHHDDPFTVLDLTSTASAGGQLAFLSACTTARTGIRHFDEPVHFAAAAMIAGYRHVIATLWPLQDSAAAELADSIYADLTHDGLPDPWTADHAAAAVHQAIHDQRATPGTPIHTWATLTHQGP